MYPINPVFNKNRVFLRFIQTLQRLPGGHPLKVKLSSLILAAGISHALMRKFPRSTWVKLGSSGALIYLVYRVGKHILQHSQLETQKRKVMNKRLLEVFQDKQALLVFTFPTPKLREQRDQPLTPPSGPTSDQAPDLDTIEEH